jgi:hypothetical protein
MLIEKQFDSYYGIFVNYATTSSPTVAVQQEHHHAQVIVAGFPLAFDSVSLRKLFPPSVAGNSGGLNRRVDSPSPFPYLFNANRRGCIHFIPDDNECPNERRPHASSNTYSLPSPEMSASGRRRQASNDMSLFTTLFPK